jgi:hypothetical protein
MVASVPQIPLLNINRRYRNQLEIKPLTDLGYRFAVWSRFSKCDTHKIKLQQLLWASAVGHYLILPGIGYKATLSRDCNSATLPSFCAVSVWNWLCNLEHPAPQLAPCLSVMKTSTKVMTAKFALCHCVDSNGRSSRNLEYIQILKVYVFPSLVSITATTILSISIYIDMDP